MTDYFQEARAARRKVLELIYKAQTSHIGSNFSCIDILTVLFDKIDLDKDQFILSKGWAAASLYYFLWKRGRITEEQLNSFCQEGSPFIGLAEPVIPEIKIAGGSMGIGLPGAVGLALAKKFKDEEGKIYCLMGDGELQCGTTWESILIATHYKLNNLVVIIDRNSLQALGRMEEIINMETDWDATLYSKFRSFGWEVKGGNGHDYQDVEDFLIGREWKDNKEERDKYHFSRLRVQMNPKIFIAHTIKGKGVSFMENNNEWHYRAPNKEHYEKALTELHSQT